MTDPAPVLLREPAHRVSRRAPAVWATSALIPVVIVAAGLLATVAFDWFTLPWWAWASYVVVSGSYVILMPTYRYRVHRWESTATAVYVQRGWLSRERRIAPMSRVQTVDLDQGPLDRIFRLATVTVTTASAAGPVKIECLDHPVALQLVDDLTRRADAEAGDAT